MHGLLNPLRQFEYTLDRLSKLEHRPGATVGWQRFRPKYLTGFRQCPSEACDVPERSIALELGLIEPCASSCSDSQHVSDSSVAVLMKQRLLAVSKTPQDLCGRDIERQANPPMKRHVGGGKQRTAPEGRQRNGGLFRTCYSLVIYCEFLSGRPAG
jgi:hypothetical protein